MSKLKYFDGTTWKVVNGEVTGDTLPIGAIVPYGSSTVPTNWLVCDGSAVSRITYAELFSAIGTSFGAGDGSTTFNLPNLKGKVPVGQDSTQTEFDTMGETGGEKTHTLTINEMPSHSHKLNQPGSGGGNVLQFSATINEVYSSTNMGTYDTGGGQAHNNLQPYQVVCYIIKAKQSAGLIANVSGTYSESETDVYSCDYVNDLANENKWVGIDTSSWTKSITIRYAIYNPATKEVWINGYSDNAIGNTAYIIQNMPSQYRPNFTITPVFTGMARFSSSADTSTPWFAVDTEISSSGNIRVFYPVSTNAYGLKVNIRYIADQEE